MDLNMENCAFLDCDELELEPLKTIIKIGTLTSLNVNNWWQTSALPEGFEKLTNLKELSLERFTHLPEGIIQTLILN